jgi:membrane-bound lytic murein transglycosylase B
MSTKTLSVDFVSKATTPSYYLPNNEIAKQDNRGPETVNTIIDNSLESINQQPIEKKPPPVPMANPAEVNPKDTALDIKQPNVQAFIKHMVSQGWNKDVLEALLSQSRQSKYVHYKLLCMKTGGGGSGWQYYADKFMMQDHLNKGDKFIAANTHALKTMAEQYKTDSAAIAGIIGVETTFGHTTGQVRAIDALVTLAFHEPAYRKMGLRELEAFLKLSKKHQWKAEEVISSFAGALGIPQFMPSTMLSTLAVDADGNTKTSLLDNPTDAIASVANYLQQHGWNPKEATGWLVKPTLTTSAATLKWLASQEGKKVSLATLRTHGVTAPNEVASKLPSQLTVVKLSDKKNGASYYLASNNFFVITKYNHSKFYAAIVSEMAQYAQQKIESKNTSITMKMPSK